MYLKKMISSIILITILILTVGCVNKKIIDSDNIKLNQKEYVDKIKTIVNQVFEKESYKGKEIVIAFEKDTIKKIQEDTEKNKWFYDDQMYLKKINVIYKDFNEKISDINCLDKTTNSMHESLILQLEDIIKISNQILKEYNNQNPENLTKTIPDIKLTFIDNPDIYDYSQIINTEFDGRINRINNMIENIINIKIKNIFIDENNKKNLSTENTYENKNPVNDAIDILYEQTGENRDEVIIEQEKGTAQAIPQNIKDKYYLFTMKAKDGSFVADFHYLVDKNTSEIYTYDVCGNMNKFNEPNNYTQNQNKPNENLTGYKCKVYDDCNIKYVHGHTEDGSMTPEDEDGNRAYGVCGECGKGVIIGENHICD